jgi:(R,R)-butanediol dehydrogenase / meso-butanediol dehydrogenase / diacetyl reductase
MVSGGRSLVLEGPHEFRIQDEPNRAPGPDETVVQPVYVGLCGTDLHIAAGLHPRARFPLVLGHEIVGVATGGRWAGRAVVVDPTVSCGECVACANGDEHICRDLRLAGIDHAGGLADHLCVPDKKLHLVPPDLPLAVAALAEPLAVAVHAVARAGSRVAVEGRAAAGCRGARVVVLGAGPIGLLTAMVARASDARAVHVIEPAARRRETAAQLGFATETTRDGTADIVFEAAGTPDAVRCATRLVRPNGVVVIVAVHGEPVPTDLRAVTFAELTLTGARVYTPADIDVALTLLAETDLTPLISQVVDLEEVPAALRRLERGEAVKILVRVPHEGEL